MALCIVTRIIISLICTSPVGTRIDSEAPQRRPHNSQGVVNLVLVYQPSDTFVHGIPAHEGDDATPPNWNLIPDGDLIPWYSSLFEFSEAFLDDDGGLIVLMPCGLSFELHRLAHRAGLEVKAKWICNQSQPLVHPLFPHMMVRYFYFAHCT